MSERTVWIPAVPLPFIFLGHDRCGSCGRRFFGRRLARRHHYEVHWRLEHEHRDPDDATAVFAEAPEGEARRIYAEVEAAGVGTTGDATT